MWALLLVLASVGTACLLWGLLLDWAYSKVKPRLERWIWRRSGGTGDPPEDLDEWLADEKARHGAGRSGGTCARRRHRTTPIGLTVPRNQRSIDVVKRSRRLAQP